MTLSKEQIKALANPYQELGNGDALAEHLEELNKLDEEERRELATKIVFDCPEGELNALGHAIKASKMHGSVEETFYDVLSRAFEVRSRIKGLHDSRNLNPHNLLLGKEFNTDLFNEFNAFSLSLVDKKALAIAIKLTLSTPVEQRNDLIRNARNAFPGSLFVSKLGAAFALRREIDLLLGDEPYKFFISPEFNENSYLEFAELFQLIEENDEEIAAKLATTPEVKRAMVLERMALIFPGSILLANTQKVLAEPVKSTAPTSGIFQSSPVSTTLPQEDNTANPTI